MHVNVRNGAARGDALTAREIVHVTLAWVTFDLVTSRFARAWMWRQSDSAPMLATGPEFRRLNKAGAAAGEAGARGDDGLAANAQTVGQGDVVAFFRQAHALLGSARFARLDDEGQVRALFGPDSPASGLTRNMSLNLLSVAKHGTLEARRFHGCLDGALIAHWAHFVVGFVESFRAQPAEVSLLQLPVEEALRRLQRDQERATPAELAERMGALLDPAAADALLVLAGSAPVVAEPESGLFSRD